MKRRKVIGLILITSTFIYFVACLLALYQNQRVKMEKGIEEALKAYSELESLNIKELSRDFGLQLDKKLDVKEGNKQIMKFEGSFERIENNISNVTDDMALVEYNINYLSDRLKEVENFYNELHVELSEKYDLYEDQFIEISNNTLEIQNNVDKIEEQIATLKEQIQKNDVKQDKNTEDVQVQLDGLKREFMELLSNALLYEFDAETQTLHVYGDKENEEKGE